MSYLDRYFQEQARADELFWNQAVVIYHSGPFYEIYERDGVGKATELSVILERPLLFNAKENHRMIEFKDPTLLDKISEHMRFIDLQHFHVKKYKKKSSLRRMFQRGMRGYVNV